MNRLNGKSLYTEITAMKIICVGRNYSDHVKELNNTLNETPVIFLKPDTALLPKNKPFFIPDFSDDIQYEAELVLKISKTGKRIEEKFAHKYYDELSVGIDFTARDLQQELKSKGLPWELSKAFDGSAPVGKFLPVTELQSRENIRFSLLVNGEVKQEGSSEEMLFSFAQIISYVSQFITLYKGDLIFTGTPAGVGKVNKGDKLKAFIEEQELLCVQVK